MNSFNQPQTKTETFNKQQASAQAFTEKEEIYFDAEEVNNIIQAMKGVCKLSSQSTDLVSYEIRAEGYCGKDKAIFAIQVSVNYFESQGNFQNEMISRNRTRLLESHQFEFTDIRSFYVELCKLCLKSNYKEYEPLNFFRENFKNFMIAEYIKALEEKQKHLKAESMFDFSNKPDDYLKEIEEKILAHKKKKANQQNQNQFLKYIKNNKLTMIFDFFLGTGFWFFIYYLLSSMEYRDFNPENYEHFLIAYYLKFMMMQHWYSIPFFWATGLMARNMTLHKLKYSGKNYYNSLDDLKIRRNT